MTAPAELPADLPADSSAAGHGKAKACQSAKDRVEISIYVWAALLLSLCTAWHFFSLPYAISGDTAMYLQTGQFLLEGKLPYRDFQDLNPPLIMYVCALPAIFARLTQLPLAICGIAFTTAVTMFALWLTYRISGFIYKEMDGQILASELFAPALLAPCLLNALASFDYGQREHYFALFLLPFVLLRFYRYKSLSAKAPAALSILIGLMLGLTLSFKPYFFLPPIVLELYWQLRHRRPGLLISPECLACALPVLIYLAHFALLPSAVTDLYFHAIAPLLVHGYACFNMVKDVVVYLIFVWAIGSYFIALALAGLVIRKDLRAPLLILISTSLALVELQQKFWTYHNIPLYLYVAFTIILALATIAKKWSVPLRTGLLITLTTLFCFGSYIFHQSVQTHWATPWEKSLAIWSKPGDKVMLLDSSDTPWFKSALRFDLKPGSRYLWLFAIPMLEFEIKNAKTIEASNSAKEQLSQLFININADFNSYHPDFILVSRAKAFGMPEELDLLAYCKAHGLSQALDNYETLQPCGSFDLLMRKDLRVNRTKSQAKQ